MNVSTLTQEQCFGIAIRNFESIVEKIDDKKTYQKALRQANKKYDIKNFKVLNMTPVKARKIYPSLLEKYGFHHNSDIERTWLNKSLGYKTKDDFLFGQLYAICLFHKKLSWIWQFRIKSQTFQEFSLFSSIFNNKKEDFLKFQLFALIKKEKTETKWAWQEDNILRKILNQVILKQDEIDWNEVSKEFFQQSQHQYYRSSKQCRQRWMNHLDPYKIKGVWEPEQDLVLLKFVQEKGKKWSQIVKDLDGCKTEHMVKNRYNSIINKKGKAMGRKNEQKILNKLIEELQSSEVKNLYEAYQTSSKEYNQFLDNKSQQRKSSDKNDELPNIFQNDSAMISCGRKNKFFVQRAGSLSMSERGGILPDLTNPILEENDSEEQRSRQKFLISTPLSQRGGDMKSPSMFFMDENIKLTKEIFNSEFSLSFTSNFDKFVPQ